MVRGFDIAASTVSAAPLPVRAASAARLLKAVNSDSRTAVENESAASAPEREREPQVFRYNSFEFRYRQDVGRIVLIGQSPETGERVVQVPSETALRAYAQRLRAQKLEVANGGEAPESVQPLPAQPAQTLSAAPAPADNAPISADAASSLALGSAPLDISV